MGLTPEHLLSDEKFAKLAGEEICLNQRLNESLVMACLTLDKLRESKISSKQKIIRILFKVTRLLFNELRQENELLKEIG